VFWLIITAILLAVFIFLIDEWRVSDDRLFVILLLVEAAIVMLLINISRENLLKVSLTVLISSFSVLLFFLLSNALDIYPDFFEEILLPLSLALIIPSGTITLLKLVWKK
jgi:hypothetical protein